MRKNLSGIKRCLYYFLAVVFAALSTAFFISVVESGNFINFENISDIVCNIFAVLSTLLACLSIIYIRAGKIILNRIFFFLLMCLTAFCLVSFIIIRSGLIDKIDSVEDLRAFISSFGGYSAVLYVVLQFLQVAVFPIPSFITIGAGVLLFGPLKAALLGVIGIIAGSVFAFIIARHFGVKAVKWLVGANNLEKGLKVIEGKDEILLTFMFIFPFFPDDILCFMAGLTKIKTSFFIIMIITVRILTVFISCFSINNSLIPYDTWWGAVLWAIYFVSAVIVAVIIYKKGDIIERKIKERFKNKGIEKIAK